jgi:hypothetical protein
MKIHLALVSEQTLPNLIPILMEQPDKVYLFASKKMSNGGYAKHLADIIKHASQQNGTQVETALFEEMPDAGMINIQDYALESATKIRAEYPDAEITLNSTGGNKLMAMGLVEVWRGEAEKIIYADTQHGRIEILPDSSGKVAQAIPMGNQLDVPLYLRAQKFSYAGAASDDPAWLDRVNARKQVCKQLAQDVTPLTGLISDINRMAGKAVEQQKVNGQKRDVLLYPEQQLSVYPGQEFSAMLKMMRTAELILWKEGSKTVRLIDMDTVRFLQGGWLEEYAWHVLHDEKLFDVRLSVNVTDKQTRNEFDVLACHHNQLLFVECKTLRFGSENDNEIAYKVDSLGQDARGLFGQTWLLSARSPTSILKDRAAKARIRIIGPDELPKLRDIVRAWKSAQSIA